MYISTSSNFGQVLSPSTYGKQCLQDLYPIEFVLLNGPIVEKSLDDFYIGKWRLRSKHKYWILNNFVPQILQSWKTSKPIRTIMLVGHADEVGEQAFNYDLGLKRAKEVQALILNTVIQKDKNLAGKINILTFSQGECWPRVKNAKYNPRNRRVEVFALSAVYPPTPGPTPQNPVPAPTRQAPIKLHELPEGIRKKIEAETEWQKYLTKPLPTLPQGKSFKEWFDGVMARHKVPKWLRNRIWDAIVGKDKSLANTLLEQAGIRGGVKDSILGIIGATSQVKVR